MFSVMLPYPPTANHCYQHTRGGRHYMTKTAREYKEFVAWKVRSLHPKRLTRGVRVAYIINPPDRRRRDIANTEKILTDALESAGLFDNDAQISTMLLLRAANPANRGTVAVVACCDSAPIEDFFSLAREKLLLFV